MRNHQAAVDSGLGDYHDFANKSGQKVQDRYDENIEAGKQHYEQNRGHYQAEAIREAHQDGIEIDAGSSDVTQVPVQDALHVTVKRPE